MAMNADEFVLRLRTAAPSKSALATVGIVGAEAAELVESHRCQPRSNSGAKSSSDAAIRLVKNWDASRVEIGMLRFAKDTTTVPLGIQVGQVEADPLVVRSDNGELVVVELGLDHTLWPVAKRGDLLLDALLVCARALNENVFATDSRMRNEELRAIAAQCAQIAGGPKFHDFYLMLLGVE
jgi:hypothetical protein